MRCPQCDSEEIDQTSRFDQTVINEEECWHDFECFNCGCLFRIGYAAHWTQIVEKGEENEQE